MRELECERVNVSESERERVRGRVPASARLCVYKIAGTL